MSWERFVELVLEASRRGDFEEADRLWRELDRQQAYQTHEGGAEYEERQIRGAIRGELDDELADEYYHARIDFIDWTERQRGERFATSMARVRAFDARFMALDAAWAKHWKRLGVSEIPPRRNFPTIVTLMKEAIAFYRALAPELYAAWREKPKEPVGLPPAEIEPLEKERKRELSKSNGPLLSRADKRRERLQGFEEKLLATIRTHPGLALGAYERKLGARNGALSTAIKRLLALGYIENRGSRNRPEYHETTL